MLLQWRLSKLPHTCVVINFYPLAMKTDVTKQYTLYGDVNDEIHG